MNAELQKFSLSLEMEQKQREMARLMEAQKAKILEVEEDSRDQRPVVSLSPDIRNELR